MERRPTVWLLAAAYLGLVVLALVAPWLLDYSRALWLHAQERRAWLAEWRAKWEVG